MAVMAEQSPVHRLREIAEEIRCLPKAFEVFSCVEGEVATRAGELLAEALELRAFAGKEYAPLRAVVARHTRQKTKDPDEWQVGVWHEAVCGEHSLLPDFRGGHFSLWVDACGPVADLLEAEAAKLEVEHAEGGPLLEVASWSDLGIGIDQDGYWAITPCPECGGVFATRYAKKLELRGPRWKTLLEGLANSDNGNFFPVETIHQEFGLSDHVMSIQGGLENDDQSGDDQEEDDEDREAEEPRHVALARRNWETEQRSKLLRRKLIEATAQLSKQLRRQVRGPGRGSQPPLSNHDPYVVTSTFVVRHLLQDPVTRQLCFGRKPA